MTLNLKQVARIFNITEAEVQRLIRKRGLPSFRIRDHFGFNRPELLEWATLNRVELAPAALRELEADELAATRLIDALKDGGVCYDLPGSSKAQALQEVVKVLALPADVDRDFICRMLLAREQLASTGVGDGIAIPHPRNPILLHVHRPLVSLCFMQEPLDFGALDGKPVFALFTLITANARQHLQLLSRLSFCLRDPALKELLRRRAERGHIEAEIERIESRLSHPAGEIAP